MLKETILNNWVTDICGHTQIISDTQDTDFPAWTIKLEKQYGVAIPYAGVEEINERFAGAKIQSCSLEIRDKKPEKVLMLTAEDDNIKNSFASLCEALADPGKDGIIRNNIEKSPVSWWKEWKELLGNRNIEERIYDVLGELCVLLYAVQQGEEAKWNGPSGASYDIETDSRYIEVKSTVNRSEKEVTISNQFQLYPVEKPLDLVYCVFEPTILSGLSIDGILSELESLGLDTNLLNNMLKLHGLEKGMSARKKNFILHEMLSYKVDDSFPRISPVSFVGGVMPKGIKKITYTVDLSGLDAKSLIQGEGGNV